MSLHLSKAALAHLVHGVIMSHFRDRGRHLPGVGQIFHELNADEHDHKVTLDTLEEQLGVHIDGRAAIRYTYTDAPDDFRLLSACALTEYIWATQQNESKVPPNDHPSALIHIRMRSDNYRICKINSRSGFTRSVTKLTKESEVHHEF